LKNKEVELEAKTKKRLMKLEEEIKKRLESEYDEKINKAIEYKEKELKIKYTKALEFEKVNIEKGLKSKIMKEVKEEWTKLENEKIEIARQKATLNVKTFNKQNTKLIQGQHVLGTKCDSSNDKKSMNSTMKYEYNGKLLLPLNQQLINKALNTMLI